MSDVQVFDVILLSNMQIGKTRLHTTGTRSRKSVKSATSASAPSRRSTRSNTEQEILRQVQSSTLHKYCTLCKSLNVDPLTPYTLVLVVMLMSRHPQRIDIARKFLASKAYDDTTIVWKTAEDIDFLQQKFSSSSDWGMLLSYLEFDLDDAARAVLAAHPVLNTLQKSLLAVGIITMQTPIDFVMHCLLYMTPAGTPSPKMLERYLGTQNIECRDVEVKCLRAVTSFTDQINNESQLAGYFLDMCLHMRCAATLHQEIEEVLRARLSNTNEPDNAARRIRLRDIVESVHQANALSYELTFDSWCCQKQFASTTGLNVQRLLYFINAQTCGVDFSRFPDYFTPAMTSYLALKELSTIDIAPINAVIGSLRLYTNNIKHLIDFRVLCLEGLNVKARQSLSQAQILQLYICCYQHASIRDRCWRAVLPVLNHSIQRACVLFRDKYAFEIEAVVRSVIFCHVNNAQGGVPGLPAAAS